MNDVKELELDTNLENEKKLLNELELSEEKNLQSENSSVENIIETVTDELKNNITEETKKEDVNLFEKYNQSKVKEVVDVALENVLKVFLKKKLGINFSTFNKVKDTIEAVFSGDLKTALKKGSDAAIDNFTDFDSTTKSAIKNIKNTVIEKTVDNQKYEILEKQTKILNRINKNCNEFDEAMNVNDEKAIKRKANAIKKDMQEILPIKEIMDRAQIVLDKYTLWQNKGNVSLTMEENELLNKFNQSA